MTRFVDIPDVELDAMRPAIVASALVRHYESGIVAWSSSHPRPVALRGVPSIVFQILDGSGTVSEMVEDIHEVVGIPKPVARTQLRRVLDDLDDVGLLAGARATETWSTKIDLFPAPPNP